MERSAGILLSVTSLPSPYGIGTIGKEAREFADFLKKAGQKVWQILPVGPTSYGDSPYQSFSTYAGNPYLIDLDTLCEEGLITKEQLDSYDWGLTMLKWITRKSTTTDSTLLELLTIISKRKTRRLSPHLRERTASGSRITHFIWL